MTRRHRVRPFVSTYLAAASVLAAGFFLVSPRLSAQTTAPWDDAVTASPDFDQDWTDEVPAHVSFTEGEGWLDREGVVESDPAGVPLLAGDRLRTRQGRIEVLFSDGSALSLDENTEAELLSDTLLRVAHGRIRLDLTRAAGAAGYRVDAGGTTTWIRAAGEYRLELDSRTATADGDVRLLVVRGQAELTANGGRTLVRAGYEAFGSSTTTPSLPYAVTVARWDIFDRWWDERRADRSGVASAQYLPAEVSHYSGVLDRTGDWQYEPTHGYVWYPRVVDDWHPYSTGRWSFVGAYGWVWVGADRWAWPTHHYGRWGYSGRRYYWIPGRQWAPAWVSWASSPGYVGWAPLGYDNRPLVSVHVAYSSGWRGWSVVPTQRFSARVVVSQRGRYLPPRGEQFSDRFGGPGRPSTIVTRQTPGIRGPGSSGRGSVAVPRVQPARAANLEGRATPGRGGAGEPFRNAPAGNGRVSQMPSRGPASALAPAESSMRSPAPAPALGSRSSAAPPRAPQRIDRTVAAPDAAGARPRMGGAGRPAPPPNRSSQPQTSREDDSARGSVMRSRVPAASMPSTPRVSSERPRPATGRQPARTEAPGTQPSAPSRQRVDDGPRVPARVPERAPQGNQPRPQAPAARQAPAERQAPTARQPARQAPSESGRGRAVPRGRE